MDYFNDPALRLDNRATLLILLFQNDKYSK